MRAILALAVVLAMGTAAGGAYWKYVEEPGRQAAAARTPGGRAGGGGPVPVEAMAVQIAPAETTVTAVGTLRSFESVVLASEVSGRIAAFNFIEGKPVAKGAVLVELDSTMERAALQEAEAAYTLAQSNFERARELRRTNVGTQRTLDEAQAELIRTRATVTLVESRLSKRTLVAPFDAVAGLRQVSVGAYITDGDPIVNLEQIDPLKVDFRIPEVFLGALAPGQKVQVQVDAFSSHSFAGELYALNPLVDEAGRSVVIRARIENDDGRLRPGLFARVTLTLAERAEALFVPEEAIIPQGGRTFVFKVQAGEAGKPPVARMTEVQLGKRLPGRVEVTAGLGRGDAVVSAGVSKIRDGVAIAVKALPGAVPTEAPLTSQPTSQPGGQRGGSVAAVPPAKG